MLAAVVLSACAPPERPSAAKSGLKLGLAVDTSIVPGAWWGVDSALAARAAVVRTWDDYLAIRADSGKRLSFWSAGDRGRTPDPDLILGSEGYVLGANAVLLEAIPLAPGDSSRWLLRTMYSTSHGTGPDPDLLALERMHVIREGGRWVLSHPSTVETAAWHRVRVGLIEYVVHPALSFDAKRAADTAEWAATTSLRFGITNSEPITYYQVPDLQAALQVMGLDWGLSADRVGGRANSRARVVFAADPRFGEAYRHELAHVLLYPVVAGSSVFASEGIAYWLGGARGKPFPAMMNDLGEYLAQHPALGLRAILTGDGPSTASSVRLPAAAAMFEIAHRRGGDAGVQRFLAVLGKAEPSMDTVARALELTPAELDSAWRTTVLSYATRPR
jgi:hypothetical protein